MIQVKLAKSSFSDYISFTGQNIILLDEERQRALPLWLYQPGEDEGIALHTSLQKDSATMALARPRTLDLLTGLLKALGGKLEEVCIDLLPQDQFYAQIYLSNQHGRHAIKALLDDALPLAIRLKSTISVANSVPESKWVDLAEQGATLEQQLETIMHKLQTNSAALYLKREPRNLDFADELRGWQFMGDPESCNYHIDRQTTCTGKASLAIELHQKPSDETILLPPGSAIFHHEGFLADRYRGQHLCMTAWIKAEYIQQLHLHLTVSGPPDEHATDYIGPTPSTYGFDTNTTIGPITDASDWTQHELVIDIPQDAFSIGCHFIIEGACKIWLDGIYFEVQQTSNQKS